MDNIFVTCGDGDFAVSACATRCGDDISITVTGGTKAHVGAVSLAVYEPERNSATVSTVTVFSHRDDAVSSYFAKEVSRAKRCTVCASAGLHVDEASSEEIALLRRNAGACCAMLIEKLN